MKLSEAFPKPKTTIASGETLMRWFSRDKAGEIHIYRMDCITGKNGSYKLFYNESHHMRRNPDPDSVKS